MIFDGFLKPFLELPTKYIYDSPSSLTSHNTVKMLKIVCVAKCYSFIKILQSSYLCLPQLISVIGCFIENYNHEEGTGLKYEVAFCLHSLGNLICGALLSFSLPLPQSSTIQPHWSHWSPRLIHRILLPAILTIYLPSIFNAPSIPLLFIIKSMYVILHTSVSSIGPSSSTSYLLSSFSSRTNPIHTDYSHSIAWYCWSQSTHLYRSRIWEVHVYWQEWWESICPSHEALFVAVCILLLLFLQSLEISRISVFDSSLYQGGSSKSIPLYILFYLLPDEGPGMLFGIFGFLCLCESAHCFVHI